MLFRSRIACFDEEGQHMLEGSSEPTVCVVFSPKKADEVKHAMRVIERFVAFNTELFELVEELQGLCFIENNVAKRGPISTE